ncbi:MAG TPA: HAMP domain-containing sensor histidine kinase, partial [Candidatus Limnocylindria bacterium]|nr:HAMP domain-containing sensor histidine kinase [Candidatus Limnocylindria bacterium]
LGLAVRWWIVTALVASGRPTSHPAAIAVAELGGYAAWGVLSLLPIYRYNVFYSRHLYWPPGSAPSEQVVRTALQDVGLIHLFALTPFVLLMAYGYEAHGLAGAVAWALAALGLHFMLRRLNERRLVVEEQNRRLAALNRELEHRERLSAIGKMSSVISHQMLQQLGVIGIHADLIRHGEGDPAAAVAQAKANAAAIENALGGVNRVLTDLLVFSRDLRLNLYEHRVQDVLAECIEECRPQAAERNVGLRLECPPDATARLDKLKIKQAVVNVLRNAIDASPPAADVLVRCTLADGALEIAVTDHGPGIPEADREAVFTPFFTTKEHGSGLGLAIAREFAEAHGGGITVESRDRGGATFVLRLRREGLAVA